MAKPVRPLNELAMVTMPRKPGTCVGVAANCPPPPWSMPSRPSETLPHTQTVPSALSAIDQPPRATTSTTPEPRPGSGVGASQRPPVVPPASCPARLPPQPVTLPSLLSINMWLAPTESLGAMARAGEASDASQAAAQAMRRHRGAGREWVGLLWLMDIPPVGCDARGRGACASPAASSFAHRAPPQARSR